MTANKPTKIPARKTPVTAAQMFDALTSAWNQMFDMPPRRESILVLLAQWALETGRGKYMWNFNVGNAKSVPGDGHDYCFRECDEVFQTAIAYKYVSDSPSLAKIEWEHPKEGLAAVVFSPEHPACRFRAFATLEEGTADYLKMMHVRFSTAWIAVEQGDPLVFARLLKMQGYYTGSEAVYTRTLGSLFREFQHLVQGDDQIDLETTLGVQRALTRLGFFSGAKDGINGPQTRAGVLGFQRATGLVQDGIVGPQTRRALAEKLAAQT